MTNLIKVYLNKVEILVLSLVTLLIFTATVNASSFDFNPPTSTFYKECFSRAVIDIDASGEEINAADIEISFEPSEVEIIDSDPDSPGVQIMEGNAFEAYFGNEVDISNKRIRLAGGSFVNMLETKKTFATIEFKSKPGVTNSNFTIKFNGAGNTLDSNIADASTSDDTLDDVTNGSYTFSDPPFGSCVSDVAPPQVTYIYPTSGSSGIPSTATLQFRITDNISGIDLNSLVFTFNGETYTVADSEVTYTGTPNNYVFTITPRTGNKVIEGSANSLIIDGQDFAGNTFRSQMVFNVPSAPVSTPYPTPTPLTCEVCEVCEDNTDDYCASGKVYVCHGYGSENEETILIPQDSVEPHIEHGDKLGPCNQDECFIPTSDDIQAEQCNSIIEYLQGSINTSPIIERIPILRDLEDDIRANIVTSALVVTTAGLNFLSLLSILNTPGIIINFISALLGKRNRNPWGLVIDASSGKPVIFAVCKLYEGGTLKIVDQTVSDSTGRYGFPITPGSYRLEVQKSGYEKSLSKFAIKEGEPGHVEDMVLVPENLKANLSHRKEYTKQLLNKISKLFNQILPFIFTIGLIVSVVSLINYPTLLNTVIFLLYVIIVINHILTKYDFRTKYFSIIDAETALRLPNALIKIFDRISGKLVDTKLTNGNGYFDYWGDPGEYDLHVSAKGYKFPSDIQTDLPKIYKEDKTMLKVKLGKGKNRFKVLLDPLKQ